MGNWLGDAWEKSKGGIVGGVLGGPWGAIAGGLQGSDSMFDRSKGGYNRGEFNLPGFQSQYNQYQRIADQRRTAPQANASALQGDQMALIRQLQAQAAGSGPGQQLVAQHAQDQAQQTLRAQLAAQASGRGGAGAAFNASQAGAQAMGGIGNQRVMGGLQAQLNAFGQLGQNIDAGRRSDEQLNLSNADMRLRQTGMDDDRQMEALRQALLASSYQQQGGMAYEQGRMGVNMATPTGWERVLAASQGGLQMALGGAGGAGGGGGTTQLNRGYGGNGYANGGPAYASYNPGPQYRPAF